MSGKERWLGIDFSGNAEKWGPGVSKSNVWIAELVRYADSYRLVDVRTVQQLPGAGHPFARLASILGAGDFRAAGIDAPFSVPEPCVPDDGHTELVRIVDALHTDRRPFPQGQQLLDALKPYPGGSKKPLRQCERIWKAGARSTMWNGRRGGAPFTVAALKLLATAGRPAWPFAADTMPGGLIVEAFPAAQLKVWNVAARGYATPEGMAARRHVVRELGRKLDLGQWRTTIEAWPDALDAVISAFAAIAVTEGRLAVSPEPIAQVEGWIAVHDNGPFGTDRSARAGGELTARDIPSPEAGSDAILEFAHRWDGYESSGSFEAAAELANRRFQFTVDELRTLLFLEHRRWRHFGEEPDAEAMSYIRWLIEAIRQRVAPDPDGSPVGGRRHPGPLGRHRRDAPSGQSRKARPDSGRTTLK